MVYVTRRADFCASHFYHNPELSPDENQRLFGKCTNPHGHGHNYRLEVTVAGAIDPRTGMVIDVGEIKKLIESEIMQAMDHRFLNEEVPAFRTAIPTSENIAIEVWKRLDGKLTAGRLHRVRLYETQDLYVDYYGGMMVYLTRRYRISAAHRLHNPALTDEENAHLYGKCNNPRGHGHDYALEITVCGKVNPATGMVIDLGLLDDVVQHQVLERFDHKHLNLDVEDFRARVPTTENLCLAIYGLLAPCFPLSPESATKATNFGTAARLEKVRVEETLSNFFEYSGEESFEQQR